MYVADLFLFIYFFTSRSPAFSNFLFQLLLHETLAHLNSSQEVMKSSWMQSLLLSVWQVYVLFLSQHVWPVW